MRKLRTINKTGLALSICAGLLSSGLNAAVAAETVDGYKQVKRLGGTSQSICRPAINTADDLKSFAANQREDVIAILESADWSGDPDAVFAAIEAGEFEEKSYQTGTRLEWMGMRENGTPIAAEKRQWAGEQAFVGFELNIVSNCAQHQLVIPKACCNLSLVQSSAVDISKPVVSVSDDAQTVTVTVNSFGTDSSVKLTYPDSHSETLELADGKWTGALEPGSYKVEAMSISDCGESAPVVHTFNVAPLPVATTPAGGFFFAPFIGRQVRSIDPPLIGIQAGWLNSINDKTDWFIQGGGSYNLDASELSVFVDLGIERKFGESGGFFGAGLGVWDINNSDDLPNSTSPKTDLSYFIHGGANTPWEFHDRPVQWFVEARIFDDFTDDISHHNILKLGLRYMY